MKEVTRQEWAKEGLLLRTENRMGSTVVPPLLRRSPDIGITRRQELARSCGAFASMRRKIKYRPSLFPLFSSLQYPPSDLLKVCKIFVDSGYESLIVDRKEFCMEMP